MKILLVMDPGITVPPKGYGGHERLVYMFARQYHDLGHHVELLATPGSEVEGCTVHEFGKEGFPPGWLDSRLAIPAAWKFLWRHRNDYDLVHNFGRLAYLIPILAHPVRKIMSYGRQIDSRNIGFISRLPTRNLVFTAPSDDCASTGNVAGEWRTVYNAIDFSRYTAVHRVADDAPLIFLGRLERVKGCHVAIRVARQTGNRLIIAGNVSPLPEEIEYFRREIEPHVDNGQIQYVGAVNDEEKNRYLGQAKALLFPVDVREAFGMVMVEAMACGTPVIGFPRGAVPEVVDEGITGFVVRDEDEMVAALDKVPQIDRKTCSDRARQRFDVTVVADAYLSLFPRAA